MIRDWGCPNEFQFGVVGGEAYVQKQLQVGKVLKDEYREYIGNKLYIRIIRIKLISTN